MNEQNPLSDPKNWNKPKSWIVPLAVTVMVDDPSGYDDQMKYALQRILNELRAICKNMDKSGLKISFLEPIRDVEKFKRVLDGVQAKEDLEKYDSQLDKMMERKIKEMKEKGQI